MMTTNDPKGGRKIKFNLKKKMVKIGYIKEKVQKVEVVTPK